MAEPLTLYKLMILYLLKKVNYPLANGQMSEFFVSKSYTDYFTFQMVINELLGTSLIHKETIRNTSRYELTKEGEEVLFYFENKITGEVKQDMDDFLKENKGGRKTHNIYTHARTGGRMGGRTCVQCIFNERANKPAAYKTVPLERIRNFTSLSPASSSTK